MKTSWIGILALMSLAAGAAHAADEPSVLVKTEPIRQQTLAMTLTGYGVVSPDTGGAVSINFPRAGQIARLAVTPGQIVKRGEALAELITDPAAALGYAQAESALKLARSEVNRVESLVKQQLATQSQLAIAKKSLQDAEAALLAQRKLGAGVAGELVRAPFDGVVTAISVAQGDRIQAGAPALQLMRRDALRVQLGIEPEDNAKVKPDMPVRLISVFDESHQIDAVISEVHGMINPQTQLVDVAVRLKGAQSDKLIPGMRVRGVITVAVEKAWAVPRSAVLRDGEGAYIYQSENGRAKRINVTAGAESNGMVAISGEFDTQLPVVVLGNYELQNGMALREEGK